MRFFLCLALLACCGCASLALTDCQEHRERELKSNSRVKLVPRCDANGDYEALQCFEGSPFCMCWRKDGTHITEPSLMLKSCACIAHRDRVAGKGLIGNYRPQCESDGTYSRTQCHGGMGFCWCVDEHGRKVDADLDHC